MLTQTATSTLPPHIFNLMAGAAMEEARRLVENKKGINRFEWRGASKQLFSNTDREVIMSGPAGSSKSMSCIGRLHQLALDTPGFRGLIVRNTRSSLSETGLVTFEQNILGLDHPMLKNGPRRQWRNDYRYDNGAIIVIGGMDKPSKVLSGEYDVIYVQQAEELTEDAWETLITRLRNYKLSFQQMIGDCNPSHPTHWLKRRADTGAATMLESRHEDNPLLWDDKTGTWTEIGKDYLSKLDSLTGVRLQRLRFGRWVAAEGMIYEDWDRAVHIVDPFPIPREWKRFRTIDFGYTNPIVVQWWCVDGDGRMYLYREFYHTKKTVREVAQVIKKYEKWYMLNPDGSPRKDDNGNLVPDPRREPVYVAVCDHDAEDRATLEAEGIATIPADKRISVGIQTTQHRLKVAGDGRPRLFIMRGCLVYPDPELIEVKKPFCTEQEFDGYVWLNKANKDVPLGKDDHGLDCVKYSTMYLDAPGVFGFDKLSGANLKDKSPSGSGVAPRNWNPTGVQVPTGNRKWSV